jgi:hypothetical protein
MPNRVPQIEAWRKEAAALPSSTWKSQVPRWVFHAEAMDVVKFHKRYWEPTQEGGRDLPGLKSGMKEGSLLSEKTGDELRELETAAHELHNRYIETYDRPGPSLIERADDLWREIRAALVFLFDDKVDDARDAQLAKIDADHAGAPAGQDAIALRLDDYARLAKTYAASLDGLGTFKAESIDEAIELARTLRERPDEALAMSDATRDALALRNRFLILMDERIEAVRAAARYVFRDYPDIVQKATSAYLRKQRAAQRAVKKQQEPAEPE